MKAVVVLRRFRRVMNFLASLFAHLFPDKVAEYAKEAEAIITRNEPLSKTGISCQSQIDLIELQRGLRVGQLSGKKSKKLKECR
jgi:hypothetical protein